MSMSLAEQRLPQYCYCHPNRHRTFTLAEGRFLDRRSRFICHACDKERRKRFMRDKPGESKGNMAAEQVAHHLTRLGYAYVREFKIGEFSYDFAFPRLKVLLEVDGWTYHRYKPSGKHTKGSREAVATDAGWKLIHVMNGPGLNKRAVTAVLRAAYGDSVVKA